MSSIRFVKASRYGAVKLWVLISFCMLPAVAIGQLDNTTSTPIPGVGHDYITDLNETVNPVNGALSVRIAAPRPRERGFNLPLYAYIYDSNGQFQVTPSWAYSSYTNSQYVTSVDLIQSQQGVGGTYPIPAGMFSSNGGLITGGQPGSDIPGTITQSSHTLNGYFGGGPSAGTYATCNYSDNYIYTDAQGNRHPMLGFVNVGAGQDTQLACGAFGIHPSPLGQIAGDGVFNFVFYGGSFPGIFDLHGNDLEFSGEDTNGNSANTSGRAYSMSDPSHPMSNTLSIPGLGGSFTYATSFGTRGQTSPFPFNPTPVNSSSSCPTSFTGTVGGYSGSATLSLPNQQQYTFSVDPTFGLLKTINYPSGASVTYTWQTIPQSQVGNFYLSVSSPSQPCAYLYDWPSITKRVVSVNGTPTQEQDFSYTTTWDGHVWTEKTTTVTTKDLVSTGTPSYVTKYYYVMGNVSPLERKIEYYGVNGSLLKTVNKTWLSDNQLGGECITLDDGTTSGSFYDYQFGTSLVTSSSEYNFGAVATICQKPEATPLRQIVTTYQTFPAPSSTYGFNPIQDRPSSVKLYGSGVLLSETDYGYDEVAVAAVAPAPFGHDETNYAANSTRPRGNVTTATQKCFAGSSTCADAVTHYTYDETGQVISKADANGVLTQFSYTDSYSADNGAPTQNTNTYLTSVTSPTVNGVTQTQTFKYGFNDGKLRSKTDSNFKTTTFCYYIGGCASGTFDPWFRLTEVAYPDGGATFTSYDDSAPVAKVTTRSIASPNPDTVKISSFDPLGRTIKTQLSDALGPIYTDTTYDGFGRVSSVSNPYRSTTDSTYGISINKYDALGRPISQTHPDTTASIWSYTGSVTNYKDESQQTWKRASDALGRLMQVIEPGNYETDYQYDALGNLLCVEQHGGVSGTGCTSSASSDATSAWRPRRFTYDSLSRLLSSSSPESGTTQYSYDSNGNLLSKTDARGVATTYTYDALNRLTFKHYSDGTPLAAYGYDGNNENGIPLSSLGFQPSNPIGRLSGSSNESNTAEVYSYDAMGRVTTKLYYLQSTASVSALVSANYDLAGNMTDLTYPDSLHVQQCYDAAGRLTSSGIYNNSACPVQTYLQSVSYFPDGSPNIMTLGNGVQQIVGKNNRLQVQSMTVSSSLTPFNNQPFLSTAYCYVNCTKGGSANNGDIWQIADTLNSAKTQDFTYDALNRLRQLWRGGALNTAYTIDSFGNMSPMSGANAVYHFDPASNRINDLPCATSTAPYDAAGNQICDTDSNGAVRSYGFDAEGRIKQVAVLNSTPFATYTYNADGSRVRKDNADGSFTEYLSFGGQTIAEKDQSGAWTDYIFADGKRIARVDSTDMALHLQGNNCTGCGATAWYDSLTGYTVKAGDKISWRQYSSGVARGGFSIYFTNGTSGIESNWRTRDTDGEVMNSDSILDRWHVRTVDLSPFEGYTVYNSWVTNDTQSGAGAWDIWFADIAIYSSDGTVVPIYHRQPSTGLTFWQVASGTTNYSATVDSTTVPASTNSKTTFFMGDHLGTAQLELASGGWPVWKGEFAPFGQEVDTLPTANHYKFTGKERDAESGLDNLGARYYASTMGRFMSPDWSSNPVSIPFARLDNPQTLNRYSYVGNNPLRYNDPFGHSADCNHDGDKSVVCIVTTVIDKIKNFFSGGSNSNSSGNTQAATQAPSPDPQFRVSSRIVPPSPFTNAPSFYSGSAQLGFASGSISYVPKTKNFFFSPGLAAPPTPGVMFTAGYSRRPEDFLGGWSGSGCYGAGGGVACYGLSLSGDSALQLGIGTSGASFSVGYGLDWNGYTQGLYESIPVNPMATIPGPSGLNVEDPRMGLDPNP